MREARLRVAAGCWQLWETSNLSQVKMDLGIVDACGRGVWEMLPDGITIDSGAVDSVMPSKGLEQFPMRESEGSRIGVHYVAANGDLLPNQGEKNVELRTDYGEAYDKLHIDTRTAIR